MFGILKNVRGGVLNFRLLIRKSHSINNNQRENLKWEEIKIPVPWGHLAGKWWGPQNRRPILCLHGWQESCGSFDPLFDLLLPENVSLLVFDLPGHGYSSRLPKGMYYHVEDNLILIRRIQKYLDWKTVSLLGHSLGGIMSFLYTSLYPEEVDMLITFQLFKPFSKSSSFPIKNTLENIDQFLNYEAFNESKRSIPLYTYDEMINKMVVSSRNSIWPQNCKYILNRIIEKSKMDPDKYYFSRDNRLKVIPAIVMPHNEIIKYAKRIKCPMLLIKSTHDIVFENKHYFDDIVNEIKGCNTNFKVAATNGTHHAHINQPEEFVKIIKLFFKQYNPLIDRRSGGIKTEMKL